MEEFLSGMAIARLEWSGSTCRGPYDMKPCASERFDYFEIGYTASDFVLNFGVSRGDRKEDSLTTVRIGHSDFATFLEVLEAVVTEYRRTFLEELN